MTRLVLADLLAGVRIWTGLAAVLVAAGLAGTVPATLVRAGLDASGTAALLAMAAEAVKKPARRTQIFLWPAAEEQGLIGAAAYVAKPVWPLAQTAGDIHLDHGAARTPRVPDAAGMR